MKDQYVGDISDYRKYALLRALTKDSSLNLGICWMLTPDDGGNDGNHRQYLATPERWKPQDPELFDLLKRIVQLKLETNYKRGAGSTGERDEGDGIWGSPRWLPKIETSGVLGSTQFFNEYLSDQLNCRRGYIAKVKNLFSQCDLVFFDPDNGLDVPTRPKGRRNSSKYLFLDEALDFWRDGASILIYQYYPFQHRPTFDKRITERVAAALPGCRVILFATAHVLFILAAQPRHVQHFMKAAGRISERWPTWFLEVRLPDQTPGLDVCQARTPGSSWSVINIEEAIARRGEVETRCVECHGPVRAHKAASDGSFRAHFEHVQRHDGCSRSRNFNGEQSRHPLAIQ